MKISHGIIGIAGLIFAGISISSIIKISKTLKKYDSNKLQNKDVITEPGEISDLLDNNEKIQNTDINNINSKTKKTKKFYIVTVVMGHVGRNKKIIKKLAITAENGRDAASMARYTPRVKHDQKFAIIDCEEVSNEKYVEQKSLNRDDPFFKCKNRQQQRAYGLEEEALEEVHLEINYKKHHSLRKTFFYCPKEIEKLHGDINTLEIV